MDGIAIRFDDCKKVFGSLLSEASVAAGQPQQSLKAGCFEIMTGGILPKGSDTVVRLRRCDHRKR